MIQPEAHHIYQNHDGLFSEKLVCCVTRSVTTKTKNGVLIGVKLLTGHCAE